MAVVDVAGGLEAIIAPPPAGALISLLLVVGCHAAGRYITGLVRMGEEASAWLPWQAPVIGTAAIGAVLYPLALAGALPGWLLRAAAVALCVLGCAHLWVHAPASLRVAGSVRHASRAQPLWRHVALALLVLVLVGLGLAALGPVTAADALDYHVGVAIAILDVGAMPVRPDWFHGRLAGAGEVLNALGLSVGAEAFGALLQLAGLAAVAALLMGVSSRTGSDGPTSRGVVLALAAVSAPVMVFLASSPKPQLMYQAMTTTALALVVAARADAGSGTPRDRSHMRRFALVCLLVMSAATAKLSFLLTGAIVGLLAFVMLMRRTPGAGFAIAGAAAIVIMLPPVAWKAYHFQSSLLNALVSPVPGRWPGSDAFTASLVAYTESALAFPLSLAVPSSPGVITTVIGAGLLLAFWIRPGRHVPTWLVAGAAAVAAVAGAWLGQRTSRFFVEPYFWLLLAAALAPVARVHAVVPRTLVMAQAAGTAALCCFAAVTLFPGALTPALRTSVMERAADGYEVMEWAGSVLPPDAVMLSYHRSIALAPRRAMAADWVSRLEPDPDAWMPYAELMKQMGVTHLLYLGDEAPEMLAACVDAPIGEPVQVHGAARNPFSPRPVISARIFPVRSERLPGCVRERAPAQAQAALPRPHRMGIHAVELNSW